MSTKVESRKRAVINVRVSEIAKPAYGGKFLVGSDTWKVYQDQRTGSSYLKGDGYTWDIPVIRDERPVW